jgi:phosphoheptose isomerase
MTNRQAQLEAIRQQQRGQDEAWRRAAEALSRAGDVLIAVPADRLEAPAVQPVTSGAVPGVFGIRA